VSNGHGLKLNDYPPCLGSSILPAQEASYMRCMLFVRHGPTWNHHSA